MSLSFDIQLASICFATAGVLILWVLLLTLLRWAIFHIAAKATHSFYVNATGGVQPQCATCPFNHKCPYSNGVVCHFTPISNFKGEVLK